jgi:hypothetical protein
MRVRYFYAWTPAVVVVGTAVLLTSPYLALIALLLVSLAAVAALVRAIVWVPVTVSRAISRRPHGRSGASPRTAVVLSPADSGVGRIRSSMPAGATALLARSEKDT